MWPSLEGDQRLLRPAREQGSTAVADARHVMVLVTRASRPAHFIRRSDAQLPGEAAQRPLVGDESNITLSSIRQVLGKCKGRKSE
jgi:hypothetical protein